jgi:activating signal cointegrator complex subunit 3
LESIKKGRQAMVFVHSRKDTGKSGRTLITKMQAGGDAAHFDCQDHPQYAFAAKDVAKSRNK